VLDAPCHLHHIPHDLLDRSRGYREVHCTHGDHEVESRYDVACILDELVEVSEVVFPRGMGIEEVGGEVS